MNEKVSQMQEIVFRILCDIDDYCKRNEIRYFLSGGSCLGAVRHQGFIPWDDDADIMIPRPDFDRFIEGFGGDYSKKYGVGSLKVDSEWPMQFGRVWDLSTEAHYKNLDTKSMGVFIDVFPIDGLPEKKSKQRYLYKKLKCINVLRHASMRIGFREEEKYRVLKNILHFFCKPIGPHRFAQMMENQVVKYPFDSSKYVGVSMACHYGDKETIERENMDKSVLLQFNGREMPVPVGYHQYLSNLYGNYMKIPKDVAERGYTHLVHWEVNLMNTEE